MGLATILALIDGAPGSEAALTAALTLGRRHDARVELLHVQPDVAAAVPVVGDGISGTAVEQIMDSLERDAQTRLGTARRLYEEHCVAAKLPVVEPDTELAPGMFTVAFRHVVGRDADEVLHRARLSDLTVIARSEAEPPRVMSLAFDAALFSSGRPVLLVPRQPVDHVGETVAVAWNCTREAARAVSAALPILAAAEKVVILTAREPGNDSEPSELAQFLAGHGITGRTWAFTPGPGSIGDALLGEAGKAGADLLVMGAYGHSRLRELVLGGATRGVVAHGSIPILMVH